MFSIPLWSQRIQQQVGRTLRVKHHIEGGVGLNRRGNRCGQRLGCACKYMAATPVTCGVAIEVPLIVVPIMAAPEVTETANQFS